MTEVPPGNYSVTVAAEGFRQSGGRHCGQK
ncbi:MAG: hypothetical protein JO099_11890 [Acidobacteriia bacterium]|nr:hypothetical protein [Terriglobia bacterium]